MARVAKSNSVQRKVVVKSVTPQSSIIGKTAILVVAAIIVVALTTQTTGPTAQSTDIPDLPDLPDLPDPGPVPEPSFPPIPPGTLTCQEYLDAIMPGIKNSHSNWQKAIENAYNAKSKPFNDAKNAAEDKIGEIDIKIARLWSKRNFLNRHDPAYLSKSRQILKEIRALGEAKIAWILYRADVISRRYEILDWRDECLDWVEERFEKQRDAANAQYQDCLANETDDD